MEITPDAPECPYCAVDSGIHDYRCKGCVRRELNVAQRISPSRLEQAKHVISWMGYSYHIAELERERAERLSILHSGAT